MPSDPVVISIISVFGGGIFTLLTIFAQKKVQENKAKKQPKDRMEQMFDGYERLIKQMAAEDDRKVAIIRAQQAEIADMKQKLTAMESALEAAQDELIASHQSKQELTDELNKMRKQYLSTKV
jgi:AAA+ ATPase superfamily predicted ATPase